MLVKTESVDMIVGELVQRNEENFSPEAEILSACVKQSLT